MRVIIALLLVSALGTIVASALALGWRFNVALLIVMLGGVALYLGKTRDRTLARLLLFSLIVGFGELPADSFGVQHECALVYPQDGLMLWDSPAWVPFSWTVLILQFSFFAWCAVRRWRVVWAGLALAIAGCLNIPFYETLARYADFWRYENCWALFDVTPYAVIFAEFLIGMALPLTVRGIERASTAGVVGRGIAFSLWIWIAGRVSYALLA